MVELNGPNIIFSVFLHISQVVCSGWGEPLAFRSYKTSRLSYLEQLERISKERERGGGTSPQAYKILAVAPEIHIMWWSNPGDTLQTAELTGPAGPDFCPDAACKPLPPVPHILFFHLCFEESVQTVHTHVLLFRSTWLVVLCEDIRVLLILCKKSGFCIY